MVSVSSIKLYNISFNGKIIDSHTHLGNVPNMSYKPYDLTKFHEKKTSNPDEDYVDSFVTSALEPMTKNSDGKYMTNEIEGNKKLIESIKSANAEKVIKPLAVCQPDVGDAKNIDKLFKDGNNFCGLKFHPMAIQVNVDDERYNPYMKIAEKRKLPCVFHTETSDSYAAPKRIYELAKRTPKVPVVLYHMNIVPAGHVGRDLSEEEIQARGLQNDRDKWFWDVREAWNREGIEVVEQSIKNKDANLYLETSWTKPETMVEAIKRVGPDRVLWGTDAPIGDDGQYSSREKYFEHVDKYKKAIKEAFPENAQEIEDKVFFKNAENLFGKKEEKTKTEKTVTTLGSTALVVAGACALYAGVKKLLSKSKEQPQKQDTFDIQQQKPKENLFKRLLNKIVK